MKVRGDREVSVMASNAPPPSAPTSPPHRQEEVTEEEFLEKVRVRFLERNPHLTI